nr:L-seryl-tRNA(Sec) selenium transferase [Providencia rettgeri]
MAESDLALYRQLPAIDKLLQLDEVQILVEQSGAHWVTACLRKMQEQARASIAQAGKLPAWQEDWVKELAQRHQALGQSALKKCV